MGKSDKEGNINVDSYKLLPNEGIYAVRVNGETNTLHVSGQSMQLQHSIFDDKVLIEIIQQK
jgi:FAD synthase